MVRVCFPGGAFISGGNGLLPTLNWMLSHAYGIMSRLFAVLIMIDKDGIVAGGEWGACVIKKP
jgi:hypothetical protein